MDAVPHRVGHSVGLGADFFNGDGVAHGVAPVDRAIERLGDWEIMTLSEPIFDLRLWTVWNSLDVMRDKRGIFCQRRSCDQNIVRADGLPLSFQRRPDMSSDLGFMKSKWQHTYLPRISAN